MQKSANFTIESPRQNQERDWRLPMERVERTVTERILVTQLVMVSTDKNGNGKWRMRGRCSLGQIEHAQKMKHASASSTHTQTAQIAHTTRM